MSRPSKTLRACRICHAKRLAVYLNLGRLPLANAYLRSKDLGQNEFIEELALQLCRQCGLSQLTKVVHPDRMFKNYLYVSSTPSTFREHCAELARSLQTSASLRPEDLVLDIGSNDGCLLRCFKKKGMRVVGVDPAKNLAAEANQQAIPTLCAYWSETTAGKILQRYGSPRLVTSLNVVAHVDDVHQFVRGVKRCLAPDGVWLIEVPYLLDFIERNEFDTAYHEHLSYMSLHPLSALVSQYGLEIFDTGYFPKLHGGTIRVFVGRKGRHRVHARVGRWLKRERDFGVKQLYPYRAFAHRVLENKSSLLALIKNIRRRKQRLWAYGASAKGNTLMGFFGLSRRDVPVAIDDNPKKWGFYTPGSHLRITGIQELRQSSVDYLLLLAWNFKDEIMRRCKAVEYRGAFVMPIPRAKVVANTMKRG